MKTDVMIAEDKSEDAVMTSAKYQSKIYPWVHAAVCTTLDLANTPVELFTKHVIGKPISVSFCPGCATNKHDNGFFSQDHEHIALTASRWILAEQLSDWTAAFVTSAINENAKPVMNVINKASAYVVGDLYRFGADYAAESWGRKNGFAKNSVEVKEYADEKYNYEMANIGQSVVWSGTSLAIALGLLKVMGDKSPVMDNLKAKMAGSAFSTGLTLALRAASPDKAQSFDGWAEEHIVIPLTNIVGGIFDKNSRNEHTLISKADKLGFAYNLN
jgi:hypothetical protein